MSRTTTKRAGRPGATSRMQPPISKGSASEIIGTDIPAEAWGLIEAAFLRYGENQQLLGSSKISKKKDDPQGWLARQNATISAIDAALAKVERVRSNHGGFLHEASENYALQTFGRSADPELSARRAIDRAFSELVRAVTIIERAEAREIVCLTAAAARDQLIRDVADALQSCDYDIKRTGSSKREQMDSRATASELTPFERLIYEMQIGVTSYNVASYVVMIRDALHKA